MTDPADPVDRKNLQTPGVRKARSRSNSNVELRGPDGQVQVVLTQAFGPRGDNLIGVSEETFDGFPALSLLVRQGAKEGLVHLSPIHGDPRKKGVLDFELGKRCELLCPVSKQPLPRLPPVPGDKTAYCAIYLTPERSEGAVVGISDVWGHYHSRVVDHHELISAYLSEE
ncbi:MAG: hypothetical protein U1E65_22235 [Myxococcota bacterium]